MIEVEEIVEETRRALVYLDQISLKPDSLEDSNKMKVPCFSRMQLFPIKEIRTIQERITSFLTLDIPLTFLADIYLKHM